MNIAKRFAVVVGAVAVTLVGCTDGDGEEPAAREAPSPQTPAAEGLIAQLPGVVQRVEPSVVTIFTGQGLGSGVVYDEGGIIVSNAHVVGRSEQVEIAFADGSRTTGMVLATDQITDLAVIQAEREDLPPATFVEQLPQVGELVLAMGSPLGLENTVTAGIVSGLGREIPGSAAQSRALVDLIQTDAAISPGNSGGALVNARGEVVGINEAYIPPQAGAVSLGFAIPAGTVVDVVQDLLDDGQATHPYVGVVPGRLTPEIAEALGLDVSRGVLVLDVVEGGPAAEAGAQRGDVIVSFAGEPVESVEDFLGELRGVAPGDQVEIVVNRGGEQVTLNVTIGRFPG